MTYGSNFLLLLSRLWPSVLEKVILNFFLQIPLMFFTQQNFPFTIDLWQQILLAAFFYSVLVWVAWNHLETNIFPEYSLCIRIKLLIGIPESCNVVHRSFFGDLFQLF